MRGKDASTILILSKTIKLSEIEKEINVHWKPYK